MTDTMQIPIQATYRIINGEAVQIAAEYAEVSADTVARLLIERLGLPIEREN